MNVERLRQYWRDSASDAALISRTSDDPDERALWQAESDAARGLAEAFANEERDRS